MVLDGLARLTRKNIRLPFASLGGAHSRYRRHPRPSRPFGRLGRANPRRPCFRAARGHDDFPRGRRSPPPTFAGVLDRLSRSDFPTPIYALRGNHEEIFLRFLDHAALPLDGWRGFGGIETLQSYGVDVTEAICGARLRPRAKKSPGAHASRAPFVSEQTRFAASSGDYFFCHAGVRPGVALQSQNPKDLLWIRQEFLATRARGAR